MTDLLEIYYIRGNKYIQLNMRIFNMKKMIFLITVFLALSMSEQSLYAGSSFGSSFGGGLLGGFVGGTVSNAISQPRCCRHERVYVERPVYVHQHQPTRYVEVHHTESVEPRFSRRSRVSDYNEWKQQAEEERLKALEAQANYEEARGRALKAEMRLKELEAKNKKLEVGLAQAKEAAKKA